MQAWEVDVTCPLCGATVRGNRLQRHRNRSHPETSLEDFERAITKSLEANPSTLGTKRVVKTAAEAAGTKAVMRAKKHTKAITGIVSGGAVDLGRRK